MTIRIDRVETRARLAIRRDPYWQRIAEGQYIGFRRMTPGRAGTWLARAYVGEKYAFKTLGDFAPAAEKERFDAARKAAADWFRHLEQGGSTDKTTVKAACESYVAYLKRERGEAPAKDAEGTFRRLVDSDTIAGIDLAKLKPAHVSGWRERIFALGSKSYFNRNLTALRAALNLAHDEGKVASDFAWSKALRPLKLDANEGRRELYLDRGERARLLAKASGELKPLLTAWLLLPVRPGDIAKLRVEDLDEKQRALRIPQGKSASRVIPLTAEAFAHFKACARSKLPGAWLIARAEGGQWDRFAWRDEIRDAVKAAKLPKATCAYTLRHCAITDLVTEGVDIFTIAKIAGTSVAMIDKHYGKLRQEHARKALAALSLK
jgi:integrase